MAATDESGEARKRMKMADAEERKQSPDQLKNYWSNLPPELITFIMSYLSFDEIAECRMVCQLFNESGKHLLNKEVRRILNKIRTYVNKAVKNLPRTSDQWLNMGPKDEKCEVLERIYKNLGCVYNVYAPYIADNTSCFVAGKILDLGNAMMAFDWENLDEDLFELSITLFKLTVKAQTHFNGIIIPMILKRKNQSTIMASPFGGVSNWPCGVQPVQPGTSSRAGTSCLINSERALPAKTNLPAGSNIGGQNRMIASLLFALETKKNLLESQKQTIDAQKQTIDAQKLIIDLLKAKN